MDAPDKIETALSLAQDITAAVPEDIRAQWQADRRKPTSAPWITENYPAILKLMEHCVTSFDFSMTPEQRRVIAGRVKPGWNAPALTDVSAYRTLPECFVPAAIYRRLLYNEAIDFVYDDLKKYSEWPKKFLSLITKTLD